MALNRAVDPTVSESDLADIFGCENRSRDPKIRARSSKKRFVRSHTGLARWSEGATGNVLAAYQACEAFGWSVLSDLIDKPVVPIVHKGTDAATAIKACREYAGVSVHQLAQKTGVDESEIDATEAGQRRMPMLVLSRLAQALGLSPTHIGIGADGGGDPRLGVRFRQLRDDRTGFTPTVVLGLMEAAWVIAEQNRLESWLDPKRQGVPASLGFHPQPIGATVYPPPHKRGMELAARTRELLGYPNDAPITDLLHKVEIDLGIPVVQVDLSGSFVGATMENGHGRGIVVNVGGINANVWTRRMTVAHELGHHLWDPSEDLNRLRIDERDDIEGDARALSDPIEVRANAFAAEFLAPQEVVVRLYDAAGGGPVAVSSLMHQFGISFTALKWQLHNGSKGRIDQSTLRSTYNTTPSDAWKADEGQRTDYFPLAETSFVRRGRFVDLCLEAMDANLISRETVASYLGVDTDILIAKMDNLRDLVAPAMDNAPTSRF